MKTLLMLFTCGVCILNNNLLCTLYVQAAHVGIGISGVEGLQASCASDFSIAQVCRGEINVLSIVLSVGC